MEAGGQWCAERVIFKASIPDFIDGEVDPALGKEIVRKQKTEDRLLQLAGRFRIQTVHIDSDVQIVDWSQRHIGPRVQRDVFNAVIRLPLDERITGSADLHSLQKVVVQRQSRPSVVTLVPPREIIGLGIAAPQISVEGRRWIEPGRIIDFIGIVFDAGVKYEERFFA